MAESEFIQITQDHGIGHIKLNRPSVLNAINRQMVTEIVTAMEFFDRDHSIKVILLSGNGRAFAAGADIDEMAQDTAISLETLNQFQEWDRIHWIKKPIVSAVHGYAFGGGFELVLCSDIVFAAENTGFGFPEVKLGVMPGAGGSVKLTKAVGKQKALRWLLTGDTMTAQEAEAYGLVTTVTAPEVLLEEATRFAQRLVGQAPVAVRLIKDTVNKALDYTLYEAMQAERKNFYLLFATKDQKEGMNAFIEKRPPAFRGE